MPSIRDSVVKKVDRLLILETKSQQTFTIKAQIVNVFSLVYLSPTTQLCHYSVKGATVISMAQFQ